MRAGLRCDEKPQYAAPPLQPNNDDGEADDGRRRSAQDLSHLLPLDTGEGETRPGVAHLQISRGLAEAAGVAGRYIDLVYIPTNKISVFLTSARASR